MPKRDGNGIPMKFIKTISPQRTSGIAAALKLVEFPTSYSNSNDGYSPSPPSYDNNNDNDMMSSTIIPSLQSRMTQTRNAEAAYDAKLARNLRSGNWSVRGFALDKEPSSSSVQGSALANPASQTMGNQSEKAEDDAQDATVPPSSPPLRLPPLQPAPLLPQLHSKCLLPPPLNPMSKRNKKEKSVKATTPIKIMPKKNNGSSDCTTIP